MSENRPLNTNLYRDHRAGALGDGDVGSTVRVAGWISAKRDHGGLLFLDLRDPGGVAPGEVLQLVIDPSRPELEALAHLRLESVISVTGRVVARAEENVNPRIGTGRIEVVVDRADILSSADVLPFPVERDSDVGEESRLRYRYLDMRRGPLVERLAARARLASVVRTHLADRGFLEVQTPILTASSPEGARDFLVPSRLYAGEFYALPQAPQQFKQLLMVGGVERYFQIAPCFRDEASRADRSPGEFYQIDLEMAFATQEDVFVEVEQLMRRIVADCSTKTMPDEFIRLAFADAVDRYGTDKPDLRFGLEIADVTASVGGHGDLPFLVDAPARSHVIRVLRAPGAAERSRKWFDAFADAAKKAGATGSWLQLDPSELRGSIAKKLLPEQADAMIAAVGAEPGDAVLCAVGPREKVAGVLGDQRTRLGRDLELADPDQLAFCWVVDFPMFEMDDEAGAWAFSHNPFSMPQGGLDALRTKDPGDILAYQYDLVCNGTELSSGAVRNHLPEVMEAAFAIAGYGPERIRQSFPALWNAFHFGPPPHAGIAPGFDRILMLLEDQANLREIIAFPLNQGARDLLMGAPSEVTDKQLQELHLRVVPPATD
ncbi:MAG TPA: aspartate--tRNA ligase [Acidimicrobiales bacterium]|jgi:aspartyl-tRNA synthetase|nr:aspartate--tRNA ligase [Acidimicrobiales bacterium]